MRIQLKYMHQCLLLAALLCGAAHAEDIDIFAGTTVANTSLPNVVFVLDNNANWSRQSQNWPGGLVQGQSEVKAIKAALAAQVGKLNVGLFEYVTGGSSADTDAGYTRFNLQELTISSLAVLNQTLDTIYGNINVPAEKRSSSNPYGDLPWDFYNYLDGGLHSNSGTGTPSTLADSAAYTTQYSRFKSPLSAVNACSDTYMIFIGNNANGAVTGDDTTNSNALKAAYVAAGAVAPDALAGSGTTGTPLGMPGFACSQVTTPGPIITPGVAAYCDPPVQPPDVCVGAQTFAPITNASSTACWKTVANDATLPGSCTTAEYAAGGKCFGRAAGNCTCTTVKTSPGWNIPAGCDPTGNPAKNRTFRWNVNAAAYTVPASCTTPPPTQQCYPAVAEVRGPDEISDVCAATNTVNTTTGRAYNFDDWAKFLHNYGVPLTVTKDNVTYSERVKVTTFAIDVFNAQQSADLSSVWFSAADAGGGRYFQAKNEQQIIDAINAAVGDILAVSSSFAAVTLPLSTTNSSQVENKIYIGMFRPAPGKKPRWFGNLKRYRLAKFFGQTELADMNLRRATNPLTGFAEDCAESFWTSDTDRYWESLGIDPTPDSKCAAAITAGKQWSDLPDGPLVEKGGVAQTTREGPAGTARTLYTVKSNAIGLIDNSDATPLGGQSVLNYLRGDAPGIGELMAKDGLGQVVGLRPSIHGDVVHSRPLSIRYDADTALIFYGSNDGLFRAVDADSGTEQWAFLAPEHFAKVQRLYNNTPLVFYQGADQVSGETYSSKDYFFDGPTGQFVSYADPVDPLSSELGALEFAYIFPTMRRGGRMLYGFNVTTPNAPVLMWRQGCPNLANDTGCTSGFAEIGQTWSTPVGVYVAEYPGNGAAPKPLVIVGGGFDDCLNEDKAAYPAACSAAKGKGIYMMDAVTGALVKYFATDAPVMTQVAPIDVDFDRMVDFVYAADVAGNLYRIRYTDLTVNLTNLAEVPTGALLPRDDTSGAEWVIEKIAALPGTQRRFYNSPSVTLFRGTIFVSIGSGDRERPLETNYPYAEDVQNRFYVLEDSPFADYTAEQVAILSNQTYTRPVVDLEGDTMFEVGTTPVVGEDGWYLDLPDRGEQVANPSVVAGGKVFFNTFQPGGVSEGLCALPLGIGTAYTVSLFKPEATEGVQLSAPGFPIAPIVVNLSPPQGCVVEPCGPVTTEEECLPPRTCGDGSDGGGDGGGEHFVIGGCADLGICPVEPDVPPVRSRSYFTEDIDR